MTMQMSDMPGLRQVVRTVLLNPGQRISAIMRISGEPYPIIKFASGHGYIRSDAGRIETFTITDKGKDILTW